MNRADTACCFSIKITQFRAVCPYFSDDEAWRLWGQEGRINLDVEYKPALAFLPAMQRRRLGIAARLAFDAAWPLVEQYSNIPLVFVSHDGELNRSFELWLALLREGTVSPTSFGLSVHNALPGQWSMLRGDMSENTALSVCCDGLETALAEAYALLGEGHSRVLVVVADDPLRKEYPVVATRAPFAYAMAMMVEEGNEYVFSMLPAAPKANSDLPVYEGTLDWLKFLHSDAEEHIQDYGIRRWLWQKK